MVSQYNCDEERKRTRMSQYSLSVLCHFVTLADCIRSGYVGGQFVITRNILSFSFLHHDNLGESKCMPVAVVCRESVLRTASAEIYKR